MSNTKNTVDSTVGQVALTPRDLLKALKGAVNSGNAGASKTDLMRQASALSIEDIDAYLKALCEDWDDLESATVEDVSAALSRKVAYHLVKLGLWGGELGMTTPVMPLSLVFQELGYVFIAWLQNQDSPSKEVEAEVALTLEVVQIPKGTFLMGTAEGEEHSDDDEYPQHPVTVDEFFMGKYPVTQAQWRAVATLPKIEHDLDPDPSQFKGKNRPVEQVSWHEAVEFCQRLSQATGLDYRLPSEAEWEYACRAGTTTPFAFGDTLTTNLANYDGNYTLGHNLKGEYREQTTPVGSFPANGFGLYDMHGNVWEWCADPWHDNYQGAPSDGRPWLDKDATKHRRPVRGGSWYNSPRNCRCAVRSGYIQGARSHVIGFRVRCSVAQVVKTKRD